MVKGTFSSNYCRCIQTCDHRDVEVSLTVADSYLCPFRLLVENMLFLEAISACRTYHGLVKLIFHALVIDDLVNSLANA